MTIGALGVSQSSGLAPDTAKAKDSAASIFAILDRKPKIDSSRDEGLTLPHVNGDIEIEHVSFKYPMRPHVQIFRDMSLSIPSGKVFIITVILKILFKSCYKCEHLLHYKPKRKRCA